MASDSIDEVSATEGILHKAGETVRSMIRQRPSVRELLANRTGTFEQLHAILPSDARAGEEVTLTLQAWDQCERLLDDFRGTVHLDLTDDSASHPETVEFPPRNGGLTTVDGISFETPGTQYLTLTHEGTGEQFVSNPVRVTETDPDYRLYWGDLHLHSKFSDGCGTLEEGLQFGRDVMALDVVSYTDHDTMGFFIPPKLQRRRMRRRYVDRTKSAMKEHHDEGEFVTLFAYEWTKQPTVGGHLNVYFDCVDAAEMFDSISPESNTYEELWDRLREFNADGEGRALTIPHHTAESMYPFDFAATEYDDELAPLVEVYSQWGSNERPASAGNRHPISMGQGETEKAGTYLQDALELGNRVGMTASSDFHGPRPGHSLLHAAPHLPSLAECRKWGLGWGLIWRIWNEPSYPGGLQAMYAPELTREAVFDCMQNRQVYGTSQPHRIRVEFAIDDVRVADPTSTVAVQSADTPREVAVSVAGTAPLSSVTLVKNNHPWQTFEGTEDADEPLETYTADLTWTDGAPITGMAWDDERGTDADVYYVRVRQADGGMAWAGPLWVEQAD